MSDPQPHQRSIRGDIYICNVIIEKHNTLPVIHEGESSCDENYLRETWPVINICLGSWWYWKEENAIKTFILVFW